MTMMIMMRGWRSCSLFSFSSAFDHLRQLGSGNPKSATSLFYSQISYFSTTHCKKKPKYVFDQIDGALNKFNQMLHMHPCPSIVEFNQLLGAIVRMKYYETAVTLLRKMELLGINPDVYTLNILLNSFCRLHRVDFGFAVLGKVLKLGIELDTVTFSTLINGLCIGGKVAQAVRLFDDMVREGYQPSLITYNTIVNGLCKIGDTTRAILLLRTMGEIGFAPDIATYSNVIDSLGKDKHVTEALKLFSEMRGWETCRCKRTFRRNEYSWPSSRLDHLLYFAGWLMQVWSYS
ncbi:putative pentatricopeptide repeat-containing protein At1g12700, mitochondrial [Durio zibethinus]|uniref:Pentatricopeptide repeat-containing protein At1g12700, mitochondrial n=1 Tax=Durio zibethinus TaxID=66656 RepID=A0A6P5Z448_DURZI|nr:putative pentatricopeptide repeat-containing protein At1g12700, mitochondrial [Durio zibethinus]